MNACYAFPKKGRWILFVFTLLYSNYLLAQPGNLSGIVLGLGAKPLSNASVNIKGHPQITVTDEEGKFDLNVRKIDEAVFLTITDDFTGDYVQTFENLLDNQDLGIVKLEETISLEGVLIVGSPPIRIKTDTLEFNAGSFKVRPDANVEALLKELPGVEIDSYRSSEPYPAMALSMIPRFLSSSMVKLMVALFELALAPESSSLLVFVSVT